MRDVPKVNTSIYFTRNYNIYKWHNSTIGLCNFFLTAKLFSYDLHYWLHTFIRNEQESEYYFVPGSSCVAVWKNGISQENRCIIELHSLLLEHLWRQYDVCKQLGSDWWISVTAIYERQVAFNAAVNTHNEECIDQFICIVWVDERWTT